jgi:hypothetical protein
MRIPETVKLELRVAFSKGSQPVWFRIVKYILLFTALYLFWDTKWLWISLFLLLVVSLPVHFWYRHKTSTWTKSYGMWKYEKVFPKNPSANRT